MSQCARLRIGESPPRGERGITTAQRDQLLAKQGKRKQSSSILNVNKNAGGRDGSDALRKDIGKKKTTERRRAGEEECRSLMGG